MALQKPATFIFAAFILICFAIASDPTPLQDFCVADTTSSVKVNGFACKDPKKVTAEDFFYSGLNLAGNTTNYLGSIVKHVFVDVIPGLNTLGIGIARIDFAPNGVNAPHIHPRATEILTVIEGSIEVGFITSNPGNILFTKVLQRGDVFVFPVGLIHYQRNVGDGNAVAIATLSSQNPGVIVVGDTLFGSKPLISDDILAKSFQVDKNLVDQIQYKFSS